MPTYSYTCPNCGWQMDVLKSMQDAGSVEFCPQNCTPFQPMERLYNAPPAAMVHNGTPKFHHRKFAK